MPSFLKNSRYLLKSIWHEESNRKQRVKRWVLFFAWQVWKRIVRAPIIVTLFNGLQFRAYPDCQSSSALMYTRIPDSRDILYLRAHVREGTLIDVGANVGLVTLLVADRVQHALLFEPNPIAAPRARGRSIGWEPRLLMPMCLPCRICSPAPTNCLKSSRSRAGG